MQLQLRDVNVKCRTPTGMLTMPNNMATFGLQLWRALRLAAEWRANCNQQFGRQNWQRRSCKCSHSHRQRPAQPAVSQPHRLHIVLECSFPAARHSQLLRRVLVRREAAAGIEPAQATPCLATRAAVRQPNTPPAATELLEYIVAPEIPAQRQTAHGQSMPCNKTTANK